MTDDIESPKAFAVKLACMVTDGGTPQNWAHMAELITARDAAIRAAALEEAADSLRDIRVLNLRAGWTSTIDAAEARIRALATKGSSK